ncbi:biotin--[acetyl-CoA-carboxylase] ligase [Marinobacter salinexigens]|uniref:Bifunctional ligase/repressor BirA n=1 Tax=Marinobacter salinexigens TaxID=2919747 RepID=A0A5B0V8M1_9GAMM|nr:biotin--[acetyl-CoA-carboxylase] ligase [Marinobacter salinexigens]KAA1170461.1 biotin--[acetyl-CoA-carboxylase] ligase [Marinobacter salinexigens]
MKSKVLISLLSDGRVHSGESLAAKMGVSRTAIWKQIRRAMEEGFVIDTIRGRGYQLVSDVDLLDFDDILSSVAEEYRSAISLRVLDEVDSTNAEVVRAGHSGTHDIPVVIADCQTAGRGRRGRNWSSPRGENLYLSLGLTFDGGFSVLDGLSLVLGVAVADALEGLGAREIGLKWPNDIFIERAKLGGILIELQGELQEGVVQVICGIGINVHMKSAEGVDQAWSSLDQAVSGQQWCRNEIAGALISAVLNAADVFTRFGFGHFREAWQQRDIFQGKPIAARGGEISGIGAGIDETGNYLLDTDTGLVPVRAGEISLREVL